MKNTLRLSVLVVAIGFLLIPAASHALSIATQELITVPEDEVVDENMFAAGETITINGDVHGDVYAFGTTVVIRGNVDGDVISGANRLEIEGTVAGNLRAAATTMLITGEILKNATVAGTTVTIDDSASIGWSVIAGGQTVVIDSAVAGNVTIAGESVRIDNVVGNKADITLGERGQLTLGPAAAIGGDLTYRGTKKLSQDPTAVVLGTTTQEQLNVDIGLDKEFINRARIIGLIINIFGALLVGTILVSLAEKRMRDAGQRIWQHPAPNIGWGLLFFIVTPIAVFLLMITLIGIPLAVIVLGIYLLLLYLSQIIVGICIGEWLFNRKKENKTPLIWTMMVGTLIFMLLVQIPYLGWIVSLVGIWLTLGVLHTYKRTQSSTNTPPSHEK